MAIQKLNCLFPGNSPLFGIDKIKNMPCIWDHQKLAIFPCRIQIRAEALGLLHREGMISFPVDQENRSLDSVDKIYGRHGAEFLQRLLPTRFSHLFYQLTPNPAEKEELVVSGTLVQNVFNSSRPISCITRSQIR